MELYAVTDTVHTAPLGAGMYLSPGELEADMSDSDEDRIDDDDGESDLRYLRCCDSIALLQLFGLS